MTPPDTTPHLPPHPLPGDGAHRRGLAAEDVLLHLGAGDIHVRLDGRRDAPVLLLIHGSASSTLSWQALVPLLTGCHRVIGIDLLGHGRSAAPADGDYSVPAQARTVAEAMDRLGVQRAVVVGHSSGGYTAVALAEQRPDLVTALALINTGPSLDAFLAPASAVIDPTRWPPTDEQIRRFASSAFHTGYEMPQEFVDELRGIDLHAVTVAMREGVAYLSPRTLPERLPALGKPLQVVFGDQDQRWRPSSAADYRAVPGARVAWLRGSGHTPILEDPVGTAALLLAFAEDVNADPETGR
ncbi:alpha/beta fold hydrolase [Streptomyces sp. NPDC020917]|uniref:alpha/beta fold hydrolase n=1 Tax=Streptomyces sp. NPDC020917 TaxID=3365102 RepID=UPI00378E063E